MFGIFKKQNDNPTYTGTKEDFNKFLSGFSRNLVQRISKSYKRKIGKCEFCGATGVELDSAHIHGKERKVLISDILDKHSIKGLVKINLKDFENELIKAHDPIEEVLKILCKECHYKYDHSTGEEDESIFKEIESVSKSLSKNYRSYSRLTFRKDFIEPLSYNESFSINVSNDNCTYTLTKSEFYNIFSNVVNSDSYRKKGIYSYNVTPKKILRFKKK